MSHDLTTESIDDASRTYLGQWHRLISTTNWEKGRIIHEWRQALISADAPAIDYSDDAWSRRVGNVTGQHVGRLRRVYERFGGVYQDYAGLYWSHFQAAVEWNDAEMWLEGAVQNHWSIEEMRRERWQAFGAIAEEQPRANEIITADIDEDATAEASDNGRELIQFSGDSFEIKDPGARADMGTHGVDSESGNNDPSDRPEAQQTPPFRPFADLPPLPDDLNEAFESFKLAILRHKTAGWRDITRDDVLQTLDSLKALALALA
jgi:hypothetical protein